MLTGIAVDESTGDVYISDAASNSIIRQSNNGTVLDHFTTTEPSLWSPMSLTLVDSVLYAADMGNNRILVINVTDGVMSLNLSWVVPPGTIFDCAAVVVSPTTGQWYVADAWSALLLQTAGPYAKRGIIWGWDFEPLAYLPSLAVDPNPIFLSFFIADVGRDLIIYSRNLSFFTFPLPDSVTGLRAVHFQHHSLYILYQPTADSPVQVVQLAIPALNEPFTVLNSWIGAEVGGDRPLPFYGWALYVDSAGAVYFTDRGTDGDYGRVVKQSVNGTELQQYMVSNGANYSFTGVWYDGSSDSNVPCAVWMTDIDRGLARVAADGTILHWFDSPVDERDGSVVRFSAVVNDNYFQTLLLLAPANTSTSIWRFDPRAEQFSIFTTSQLSGEVGGILAEGHGSTYIADTDSGRVVMFNWMGQLDLSFNSTSAGLVRPRGLARHDHKVYVADSGYNDTGAVIILDYTGKFLGAVPSTTPPMLRPHSVAIYESAIALLYVADSNGLVFQLDAESGAQLAVHRPMPIASAITAMSPDPSGNVYMVDANSRRLIILIAVIASRPAWNPGPTSCPYTPLPQPSSSSSTASPFLPPPSSSLSPGLIGATTAVLTGMVAIVACFAYIVTKRREEREEGEEDGQKDRQFYAMEDEEVSVDDFPSSIILPSLTVSHRTMTREEYYVMVYEVWAALKDRHLLDKWEHKLQQAQLLQGGYPPSPCSQLQSGSSSSSPPMQLATISASPSATTPAHIDRLSSTHTGVFTFLDEVTDLTILGKDSGGHVYTGNHQGVAVVVKLPKSSSICGQQWREWQAHLRLAPHPNLVHFLGALVMECNNYLVTALVKRGSLKGLLSGDSVRWYRRPYAVMRAAKEIARAVSHLHTHGLVHRDISARNILVDSDGTYVLADLGLCQEVTSNTSRAVTRSTTSASSSSPEATAIPVRWTAPESLLTGQYSDKSDVWSLGVTLWEMTSGGRQPYTEVHTTHQCIQQVVTGELSLTVSEEWGRNEDECEAQLAMRVRRVIEKCLTHEVEHRPASKDLIELVDTEWSEWEREGGKDVERIHKEWVGYHSSTDQKGE